MDILLSRIQKIFLLTWSTILIVSGSAYSQSILDIQKKKLIMRDTLVLDSFPIVLHSISISKNHIELPIQDFYIHPTLSQIYSKKYLNDTLEIRYRVLPIVREWKTSQLFKKRNAPISSLPTSSSSSRYDPYLDNQVETDEIDYNGSFVRGITMGSNQSAAINSGFNLNLHGRLRNGLEISANMTDANIPIQPEGNSASIQEFDKIFIQLQKDSHRLVLGDFDIQQQRESYFFRVDRKLQGINYQTKIPLSKNYKLNVDATAGITRGLFARNVFRAEENNQGPYKLFGNRGEAFIIVIAGTERVFINGELMKRGLENDYTINYNIGEVTFTPKRLITHDLRIIVEFQYSDRNYFRYTLEEHLKLEHKKFNIYHQLFSENDSKNQPININLSSTQLRQLSEIGNKIDSAYISSESPVSWEASRILYQKIDTIVQGISYPIFRWAEQQYNPCYQVIFTLKGLGQGNYRLKSSGANGSVYEWIAPISGISQGSYEPQILLPTPKTHLQSILGSNIFWNDHQSTRVEVSYTDHDLNAYSSIDDSKNKGVGVTLHHQIQKKIDSTKQLRFHINQEYTSDYFSPTIRYRNNEFQRDWAVNLPIRNDREQSLSQINLEYQSRKFNALVDNGVFYIPNFYFGNQSLLHLYGKLKQFGYSTEQRLLLSKQGDSTIQFYRPKASISYTTSSKNPWTSEIGFFHEIQRIQTSVFSLTPQSYFWQNYFFNLRNQLSAKHSIDFKYIYRTEQYSDSFQFPESQTQAHTFSMTNNHDFSNSQHLRYILNYRRYTTSLSTQELLNNYLGRVEYQGQFWSGLLRATSNYEIKAGREQKMQLSYIKAPNGYGNYAWKDLNNNGIFELNEAYVSPINTENTYMRYFIILPEYIAANEVNYSQFLWIQPKAIWFNANDYRKFLSKLSYQFRIDLSKKIRTTDGLQFVDYANPATRFGDTSLVFSRTNIFQQLSFNKNENKIGVDIEWIYSDAKNLLSNGVEGLSSNMYGLRTRLELSHFFTYFNKLSNGYRQTYSEYFQDRNFKYIENQIENTLSCLIRQNIKINLNAVYGFKSTGNQYMLNQQGDLELKISRKNDGIIESKFSVMNLIYQDYIPNAQVELSMLGGIQRGVNYIWNLTVGQKITKLLQLNAIYNGRKNTNSDFIIHSGNVEVRAIF